LAVFTGENPVAADSFSKVSTILDLGGSQESSWSHDQTNQSDSFTVIFWFVLIGHEKVPLFTFHCCTESKKKGVQCLIYST
jgi:hypothetical protein